MLSGFISGYETLLHNVAEITVYTLELIGIIIIIYGAARAIIQAVIKITKKEEQSVMLVLGRALALALEFKMGAEIINTVIIRELSELLILAIIIALRAILAILIHWEIKNENESHK